MGKKEALTSVKVDTELFDEFKIKCIRKKYSLNKLVNAALYLYLTNKEFEDQVTLTSLRSDYNLNEKENTTDIG